MGTEIIHPEDMKWLEKGCVRYRVERWAPRRLSDSVSAVTLPLCGLYG